MAGAPLEALQNLVVPAIKAGPYGVLALAAVSTAQLLPPRCRESIVGTLMTMTMLMMVQGWERLHKKGLIQFWQL